MLDLLFPINGVVDVPIMLIANQPMASIIGRETRNIGFAMFLNASPHAVGDPNIKNMRPACYDVNVIVMLSHHSAPFRGFRAK
jgi:hypothetical protein